MEQLRDDEDPEKDDSPGIECEIDGEERREDEMEQEEEPKEEEGEVEGSLTSCDLPTKPVSVSFFPDRLKWKKIVEDMKRKGKEEQEEGEEGQDNR